MVSTSQFRWTPSSRTLPAHSRGDGCSLTLNLDLAWFILTTHVREEDRDIGCDQTTLVADEESLLAWLRDTPPEALVALHCVRPGAVQEGRGLWRMARVREVWLLSIPEQRQGRLLVCKPWDEEIWFEPNRQDEAKSVGEGRYLLARFEAR